MDVTSRISSAGECPHMGESHADTTASGSPDSAGIFFDQWGGDGARKGVGEFRHVHDEAVDAVAAG